MFRSPGCCASNAPSKAERFARGVKAACGVFTASREIVNFAGAKKLHFQDIPQEVEMDVVGSIAIGDAVAMDGECSFPEPLTSVIEHTSCHAALTSPQAYFRAGV